MSKELLKACNDWAGFVTLFGTAILILGGWTAHSEKSGAETATIEAMQKDLAHTKGRVDRIYEHLMVQP